MLQSMVYCTQCCAPHRPRGRRILRPSCVWGHAWARPDSGCPQGCAPCALHMCCAVLYCQRKSLSVETRLQSKRTPRAPPRDRKSLGKLISASWVLQQRALSDVNAEAVRYRSRVLCVVARLPLKAAVGCQGKSDLENHENLLPSCPWAQAGRWQQTWSMFGT